jgi:hypothetical protein
MKDDFRHPSNAESEDRSLRMTGSMACRMHTRSFESEIAPRKVVQAN